MTGNAPTGDWWDMLVRETWWLFTHGDLTAEQTEQRFHSLVKLREQHDRQIARAADEREPDVAELVREREGLPR